MLLFSRKLIIWVIIRAILGQNVQKINKRRGRPKSYSSIFTRTAKTIHYIIHMKLLIILLLYISLSVPYRALAIPLLYYKRSLSLLLPFFCRSFTVLLPFFYRSVSFLLPFFYRFLPFHEAFFYRALTVFYRSVSVLLP